MSNRVEKGSSLLQKSLSEIIENELNDPRLENEIITISKVNLSSDLGYAKVFVSIYNSKDEKKSLEVLKNASGYIRKLLKDKVKFRVLPLIDFELDTSVAYSQKINNLLKNITYSDSLDDKED